MGLFQIKKLKTGSSSFDNPSSSGTESVTDVQIPQDLIAEILLFLPVKSLVRFKCVSKPWLSFIESPEFIKSHFSTSSKDGQHFNHQLLFASKSGMKHCYLSSALHNPSTNVSDIEFPFPNPQGSPRIVGVVNGLVCFSFGPDDLFICNPILKQFKRLPSYCSGLSNADIVHGFGYNESNDDYKVVKVSHVSPYAHDVKVYSLRSDSWRTIEGFEGAIYYVEGIYVNGKVFWTSKSYINPLSRALGSPYKWRIVSLDMATEKFEEVQGPSYKTCPFYCGIGSNTCPFYCGIGSFGGSLSMLCRHFGIAGSVELWVMDENGVENCWSKVYSIPCPMSYYIKKVVCILGDGEIVLDGILGLTVYRTKTKDFMIIQFDGDFYRDSFVYVESLVAL